MKHPLASQLLYEFRSVVSGYPAFVYAPAPAMPPDEVPVFVFHTIDPKEFEGDLKYLVRNGYRTLGIEELVDHLSGARPAPRGSVLLTVDDARSSFWRYGYPLLEKHGLRATLFAIPGTTRDADRCRPNLADAWAGRTDRESVRALDPGDDTTCTWPELVAMQRSGAVDVESHSLFHREVFTVPKVLDFVDQRTPFLAFNLPVTAYFDETMLGTRLQPEEYFGLPLFVSAPLLLAGVSLVVGPRLRRFCRNFYLSHRDPTESGEGKGTWKGMLAAALKGKGLMDSRFQTRQEVARDIRNDLAGARAMLRERLGGTAGDHLCLPWAAGSDTTVEIARSLGIRSCFWGVIPGRRSNPPHGDRYRIVRLKGEFLRRLPGEGRVTLGSLYKAKVTRRLRGERVY